MDTTTFNKQLLIAFFILMPFNIIASSVNKVSDNDSIALKINLKVVYKETSIDGAVVTVFLGNEEIKGGETNRIGAYKVNLIREKLYTIRISKEGYETKLVQIATAVPDKYASDSYKFSITIDMMKENKKIKNEDALEFPSALISFDLKKEKFEYDKKYTNTIKKEIREAKTRPKQ